MQSIVVVNAVGIDHSQALIAHCVSALLESSAMVARWRCQQATEHWSSTRHSMTACRQTPMRKPIKTLFDSNASCGKPLAPQKSRFSKSRSQRQTGCEQTRKGDTPPGSRTPSSGCKCVRKSKDRWSDDGRTKARAMRAKMKDGNRRRLQVATSVNEGGEGEWHCSVQSNMKSKEVTRIGSRSRDPATSS